jgi:hypothetical protein
LDVKDAFSGFLPPIENDPTANAAKAGSAIPIGFGLGDDRRLEWKTAAAWGGSCRQLAIRFSDGERDTARFTLR